MKKIIFMIISMCFMTSIFAEEEFIHAKPDTSKMIIETSGLLKASIKQCSLSKDELQKIDLFLQNIREVIHFYEDISYKDIDDYAEKSQNFYMNNFNKNDCLRLKDEVVGLIDFPDALILEQLYMKVQNMSKEKLKELNQQYIYSHKFVSSKFTQYNAGQNKDGTIWIGQLMSIEQCQEKAIKTARSSMPTYCDNDYAKILVFIP